MTIDIEKMLDEADALIASFLYPQAIAKYDYILQHDANCADALLMRGALFGETGDFNNAIKDIENSILIDTTNDSAFSSLAYLYNKKNNDIKAFSLCQDALSLNENNTDAKKLYLTICKKLGNENLLNSVFHQAEFYFNSALKYLKNDPGLLYKLVLTLRSSGKILESITIAQKIVDIDPSHVRAQAHIASSYELIGEIEKGNKLIEALITDFPNHPLVNIVYAQYTLRAKKQDEGINALSDLLKNHKLNKEDLNSALMLLGNLHDSIQQYEQAFRYFKQANDMLDTSYNPASYTDYISSIINYFSIENFPNIIQSDIASDELIFIVGMPRSGTSLIEQIISSHSSVYGAGELPYVNKLANSMQTSESLSSPFPECLNEISSQSMTALASKLIADVREEKTDKPKISDKMPHNFQHIGLIHKLLPNAKFINCVRDPRDTCLSIYFQSFAGYHPYASNLKALGKHYREYERLMNHWSNNLNIPILTVSYENVVSDTRIEVEKILNFLELPWEESCLEFHKQKRLVATASYNQVNKKIYNKSIHRWKNYEKNIQDLIDSLRE